MNALLVLVLAAICALTNGQETVQQATISGHNAARRQEAKAEHATNIYELIWDSTLATNAQQWAAKCVEQHQAFISQRGENLYYAYPKSHPDAYYVHEAITWWMKEKSLNSDGSFDCCFNNHFTCCHYSQVVSARTRRVGCAVHWCPQLHDAGGHVHHTNAAFVVCEYSPGNLAENGHHTAYAKGTAPCTACAHGDHCNDGLCVAAGSG